jgi:hypothetical protein
MSTPDLADRSEYQLLCNGNVAKCWRAARLPARLLLCSPSSLSTAACTHAPRHPSMRRRSAGLLRLCVAGARGSTSPRMSGDMLHNPLQQVVTSVTDRPAEEGKYDPDTELDRFETPFAAPSLRELRSHS